MLLEVSMEPLYYHGRNWRGSTRNTNTQAVKQNGNKLATRPGFARVVEHIIDTNMFCLS